MTNGIIYLAKPISCVRKLEGEKYASGVQKKGDPVGHKTENRTKYEPNNSGRIESGDIRKTISRNTEQTIFK